MYLFTGRHPEFDLMGAIPSFVLGLAAVTVFLVCLKAWERHGNKYSLEWGLGKLTDVLAGSKEQCGLGSDREYNNAFSVLVIGIGWFWTLKTFFRPQKHAFKEP